MELTKNKWSSFLRETFKLREFEGQNKVVDLNVSIRRYVRKGMTIYIGERSNALIAQLIREFNGGDPKFHVISHLFMEQALNLICCGLVKKITTSSLTELTPTPGPSRIVNDAFKKKEVKIENWSLCSLSQRLMAGAFDLPFMPTKSILNSSMALENRESFCNFKDPFGSKKKIGLVKALKPDLALIHGWVADPAGNTIVAPSVIGGDSIYGAKASRMGVLVSVEQIVPTSFIKEHSALVQIPSAIVKAVSEAKMGAHPQGMVTNYGISELEPYCDDYEYIWKRRKASKNYQQMNEWIKKWVLSIKSHNGYLKKIGEKKISYLREKGRMRNWDNNLNISDISFNPEYSAREMMIIAAARKTKKLVFEKKYDGVLCGIGASGLSAVVAYYSLRNENYDINLWIGSGIYGFTPPPGDSFLFKLDTIMNAKMLSSNLDAYGIFVGGNHKSKYISVLSAAQVDKHGNLNSTKLSESAYIIGSGGSNDSCNANEILVVIPLSAERFVNKVNYITCPGDTTNVIVHDMGIFERKNGEFVLTSYFKSTASSDANEIVKEIRDKCGWKIKVAKKLSVEMPPSIEELVMLRAMDPQGHFISEKK